MSISRLQSYLLPSLIGRGWGVGLLLSLATVLSGFAAETAETAASEASQWRVDWSHNQSRPDWQEPDATAFSDFAVMLVTIEEALQPYVSANDLMALFVDGEIRGLVHPLMTGDGTIDATRFLMKVYSNEGYGDQVSVTLEYYIDKLHHVFTLTEQMTLDEDNNLGIYEDYIPAFTLGSAKYPVVTTLNVADVLAAGATPTEGSLVAAFVGDECRGIAQWSKDDGQWPALHVFQRVVGEEVVLKYYDAANGRIITSNNGFIYEVGDANGDGVVDVADIASIISVMSGTAAASTSAPSRFDVAIAADANGDGMIDVADIATVISVMSGTKK